MKRTLDAMLNKPTSRYFRPVNDILAVLTLVSIAGIVLETVPELHHYTLVFKIVEYAAVAFFTMEYLSRIYVAKRKLGYIFSWFGLIDLISIAPTFVGLANLTFLKSARVLRILRLLRMVRLAKIARLHRKRAEEDESLYRLNIEIYFAALFTAILVFGTLIYIVEDPHQHFNSIPEGMIWAAEMILGGGITNIYPATTLGHILGLFARFTGLALLGVLIHVVGQLLQRWLFGEKK